jgi:hypothetical protein
MIRIVVDEVLLAKLSGHETDVELCDPAGRIVGHFTPTPGKSVYDDLQCPLSDEELDRRSREESERPLKDILRDLQARK